MMYGHEKSRSAIVAGKPTNKAERSAAELVERRAETKGNAGQQRTRRAQYRISVSKMLARIRQHIFAVDTQGGNRMRESCTYGSVRGALSNERPYRDRREFITLLGGAAAWPLVVHAQQPMPVIGFLRSASLADAAHLVAGFRNGLKEAGFVDGQNVAVEYRSADDHPDRLPVLVTDLISRKVAVIVGNTNAAMAAKAATATVPIVFASGSDPVTDGLVVSLNRPGGNVTGVTFLAGELGTKRLELLRELAPKATKFAVLLNLDSPEAVAEQRDVQAAAQAINQQLAILDVRNEKEIETAFATFAQRGADALFCGTGAFLHSHREQIVALAARYAL